MGPKFVMRVGEAVVGGTLRDGAAARALAARLPLVLRMSGTGIDLCGQLPFSLSFESGEVHRGWRNGDVNYCPCGNWLAVLFGDEENSARYGDQITLGSIDGPLDALRGLAGSYDVCIELATLGSRADEKDGAK